MNPWSKLCQSSAGLAGLFFGLELGFWFCFSAAAPACSVFYCNFFLSSLSC
ncbi:unnamed protein product, partial [Linum tenue]